MQTLKVFLSESSNPYLNLATEEWIFHHLQPDAQILFLWRNEETVVVGRNQNPWSECNLSKMKNDKVHLARRTTGGGAVFHDLGNTNFTFLSPKQGYRRENNIKIILNALGSLGIQGKASGRNDLLVTLEEGDRKFSGSAYREKQDRAFHHGTLLLHANLSRLAQYLTPNPKKLQAKGKESVRARVTNLNALRPQINHDEIVETMVKSFECFYDAKATVELLTFETLQEAVELKAQYHELSSWDWLYGKTLEFTHQMDEYLKLGYFEFKFQIADALISDVQIFSDSLYPFLIERMSQQLKGQAYTEEIILSLAGKWAKEYPDISEGIEELGQWLARQIEV
jgi:lipoate-protein ligase A